MKTDRKEIYHRFLSITPFFIRFLTSIIFILSGFFKAIDPSGTAYKIEVYLNLLPFLTHIPWTASQLTAILLSCIEFILGIYIFWGIRRKFALTTMLLLMLIYTPLTLYIYITGKIIDCGCFGEAIHLTNGQTLLKNLYLLASICIFLWPKMAFSMKSLIPVSYHWMYSLYSVVLVGICAIIGIWYLPIIDFGPYPIGTNINNKSDFYLTNLLSKDVSTSILRDTTYVFLLVSPHLERADTGVMDKMNNLYDFTVEKDYHLYGVTSFGSEAINKWRYYTGATYPFLYAEDTLLETLVHANPGLILIKDGIILGKWSNHNLPEPSLDTEDWYSSLTWNMLQKYPYIIILIMISGYLIPLITMRRKTKNRAFT